MKRSEVTADKLKALGYVAMRQFENAWRFDSKTKTVMTYFLSRPMTEVEIVEANLYTGNWEA